MDLRLALIGSFRRHYHEVLATIDVFTAVGCTVTSPARSRVLDERQEFVRFEHDPPHCDDAEIQAIAMHRILNAHVVLVVAPAGYVGRTTCYEIGRILERGNVALFFTDAPCDLPITVSPEAVIPAPDLATVIRQLGGSYANAVEVQQKLLKISQGGATVERRRLLSPT